MWDVMCQQQTVSNLNNVCLMFLHLETFNYAKTCMHNTHTHTHTHTRAHTRTHAHARTHTHAHTNQQFN